MAEEGDALAVLVAIDDVVGESDEGREGDGVATYEGDGVVVLVEPTGTQVSLRM